MIKRLKIALLNFVLKYLFNTLTYEQGIVVEKRKLANGTIVSFIRVGKTYLPEPEKNELIVESKAMERFALWKRLLSAMRTEATDSLVNKSKHVDDMVFSKAILYTLDVMEKKVSEISELSK